MKEQAGPARRLNGIILAGGKSSRFGRDKSRMELAGKRVLERLVGILRRFPFKRLAIVTAPGRGGNWPEGPGIILDDQEGLGPVGGITTSLRHLSGGILVTACDMPLISASLVEWLLENHDPDLDAVIPRHAGGIEPLLAIYELSALPILEEAIRSGRYGLHVALEKARVRLVDVPTRFSVEREFANINTPEDYEQVVQFLEAKNHISPAKPEA
ncbi:MAG: molybdenum cofactor guanylyltransferase [Deltaproteobacteria bacterium]|nr:molybdenum cofactor guanylyltransferase [Deltaproteobacteria bacterium]